jgi:ATP-dependent helicase HepA
MASQSYSGRACMVQALRRKLERLRGPADGAFGCAATLFAHQVGNVTRALSDLGVRHLIADEVGLGKTVQALMIINQVKLDHPSARVRVLVPEALERQWRQELRARAHGARDGDQAGAVELIISSGRQQRSLRAALAPPACDLLIVDEVHKLSGADRRDLAGVAASLPGLLLLSATPRLSDPSRRLEVMNLLEPFKVRRAALEVARTRDVPLDKPVHEWRGHDDLEALLDAVTRPARGAAATTTDKAARADAAVRHSTVRRVLRARREDFRGVLPQRQWIQIPVEPLSADLQRERLVLAYGQTHDRPSRVDPDQLLRLATTSRAALRERLTELLSEGSDRSGLLALAAQGSAEDAGEAKLDALTDLLVERFSEDSTLRFVIACQDDLTCRHVAATLAARVARVGPPGRRRDLRVETALLQDAGETNGVEKAIRALQYGDAHVLCASDIAEHGLDLQRADALILYSAPRDAQSVEQWIGRLDRIGRAAARPDVPVYTLAPRGSLDEKVYRALARSGVFTKPLDADDVHAAALVEAGVQHALWSTTAAPDEVFVVAEEDVAPLKDALPDGAARARALASALSSRGPLPPALAPKHLPPRYALDRAKEGWLDLLNAAGEYHVSGYRPDRPYRMLGYAFRDDPSGRGATPTTSVILRRGLEDPTHADTANPKHPDKRAALITRRRDLTTPPRTRIGWTTKWGEVIHNPLHFFDHGDPIHEALIEGWLAEPRPPAATQVEVSHDHPMAALHGDYWVTVAWLDVSAALAEFTPRTARGDAIEQADEWQRGADARWLRGAAPPFLTCFAERRDDGAHRPLTEEDSWTLLTPLDVRTGRANHGALGLPRELQGAWSFLPTDDAALGAHQARADEACAARLRERMEQPLRALQPAAAARAALVDGEADDLDASSRTPAIYRQRSLHERDPIRARVGLLRDRAERLTALAGAVTLPAPERLLTLQLSVIERARG